MSDIEEYTQRAKEVIDKINYLDLATVTTDGQPWNSPVWFEKDEAYNFYFGSPKNTQHSQNIRENGKGFVVIYDSTAPEGAGFGVYITAKVKELSIEDEVQNAISILFKNDKVERSPKDFLDDSSLRLYKVTPTKVWVNDAEEENGLYLDYRIEINLN